MAGIPIHELPREEARRDRWAARLQARSQPMPSGCTEFRGAHDSKGYGQLMDAEIDQPVKAHRIAWFVAYGTIPTGMHVLHRCDNPGCINPTHLFLGTNADNIRDMVAKGRQHHQVKTHCPAGHPLPAPNSKGQRWCRPCHAEANKRYRARKAAG
jgi:hypothetical protein